MLGLLYKPGVLVTITCFNRSRVSNKMRVHLVPTYDTISRFVELIMTKPLQHVKGRLDEPSIMKFEPVKTQEPTNRVLQLGDFDCALA